jgi:regulator of RNase E activity RraA
VDQISNMGSISASIGRRQGELGAIVDGAVRDIDHSREIGYAIWSRSVSPITGKWRVETVAVNQPIAICGVTVNPGDLVLADEIGVCFIPRERAADVLERAQRIAANEATRQSKIASGAPVSELLPRSR